MRSYTVDVVPYLVILVIQSTGVSSEGIARRSSDDMFLDPCKAAGFLGDAALTERQFFNAKKWAIKQSTDDSIFEVPGEGSEVNQTEFTELKKRDEGLKAVVNHLQQKLRNKLREKNEACTMLDKSFCRKTKLKLNEDILSIRIKWMRLKAQERLLKQKLREMSVNRGHGQLKSQSLENSAQNIECGNVEMNSTCATNRTQNLPKNRRNLTARSRRKRGAINNPNRLWSYGVIPYAVDSVFESKSRDRFLMAREKWEEKTCLIFREKEPEDRHYIFFTRSSCGCCSYVGRAGGAQAISIAQDCDVIGKISHELGHVIGFYHEHIRPDRDDYIKVVFENIPDEVEYNFLVQHDINSLNETYDYDSIMHYSSDMFASTFGLDTIEPYKKPGALLSPEIGQRSGPSKGDVRQVNKLYRCPECGRTFHEHKGSFGHVPQVDRPDHCQWRIVGTHGEKITLTITRLDLLDSDKCESDYVEVRDGPYVKSPLIKRFCGSEIPGPFTSTGNRMWVELRTSNGNGHGFKALYVAECGGEMIKDEGMIVSTNYPHEYPLRKTCVWTITVPEHFYVALMFDHFELEDSDYCERDYLELRDGPSEHSELIGKFCGSEPQDEVLTTGRHLYVKFVSDRRLQKPGFSARFTKEIDECDTDNHGCGQVCVNTYGSYHCSCRLGYQLHSDGKRCEKACGNIIDDAYGNISSPSHPDLYPADRKCSWVINSPPGYRIHLNFTYFDVESHGQGCNYDSVTVRSDAQGEVYGVFCGYTTPAPIVSKGNTLRIDFVSDKTVQNTGFFAHFIADRNECTTVNGGCDHICKNTIGSYKCQCKSGFFLDSDKHTCKGARCHFEYKKETGFIRSNNFPKHYPSRENCSWLVRTVEGHRVKLTFLRFEVEPNEDCEYDDVTVYDGSSNTAAVLGKFCGDKAPDPVISSGSNIFVSFISDASVQRMGFIIEHDVACGAHLVATQEEKGFVSHPSYGVGLYHSRQDCQWTIQAETPGFIQLTFTHFELESHEECAYDAVTVYDGLLDTDRVIGEYCGLDLPDPILSSTGNLLIHFISDDTINRKGFSATYTLVSALIHH